MKLKLSITPTLRITLDLDGVGDEFKVQTKIDNDPHWATLIARGCETLNDANALLHTVEELLNDQQAELSSEIEIAQIKREAIVEALGSIAVEGVKSDWK